LNNDVTNNLNEKSNNKKIRLFSFAARINLYGYVRGNPTKYVDPSGLSATTLINLLWHYFFGGGSDYFLPADEISSELSSVDLTTFPGFQQLLIQNKGERTSIYYLGTKIVTSLGLNSLGLGVFTVWAEGTVKIDCCDWSFTGILQVHDRYNFNRSTHRSWINEFSTTIGRQLPGTSFNILLDTVKQYSASGEI